MMTAAMKRFVLTSASVLTLFVAGVTPAAQAVKTPVYDDLRAARPDGRHLQVSDVTLERDAFSFQFKSGAFHFLSPVQDRTFAAVFVGQGSYTLNPATRQERRHLAFVTDNEDFEFLQDDFESMVLIFTDDTFEELGLLGAPIEGSANAKAAELFEDHLKWQRDDLHLNLHVRLLEDLANAPTSRAGFFQAYIAGKKYPGTIAGIDPRGAQAMNLGSGGEDTVLAVTEGSNPGLWYMSDRMGEVATGHKTPYRPLANAEHFEIDFKLDKKTKVAGTTILHFENLTPNLRALSLSLTPVLRLSKASYRMEDAAADAWTEIGFVQEDKDEDPFPAAITFPEPLAKKAKVVVKLEYEGEEVLDDAGEGNYTVEARTSWYPNFGAFTDMATYDITYRLPLGLEVVSVGEPVSSGNEGDEFVSTWRSDIPIRVAGFNLGHFKVLEQVDDESQMKVLVYTNPGTPDIIREIDMAMRESGREGSFGGINSAAAESFGSGEAGAQSFGVNTAKLAQSALADGINSARVCTAYFGPLPQRHVAITQQSQWNFGQSWPSLIYMPYISFLTSTQRKELNMGTGTAEFVNEVGYHEFAHQWWGHLIGWNSYRDTWISEGFAEFSSALILQHAQGWEKYIDHWESSRKVIVSRLPGKAQPSYKVGPISQGGRLGTRRSPAAANVTIYNKGGYVVHMLRMLMREPTAPNPDVRFIAMMKDFTATWANKSPSNDDFQVVVERHMTSAMNATGDGKMDWFFDQWVHGTDVPKYTHNLKVQKAGGKYRVQGKLTQADVSAKFRALVPLYVEFKKGEFGQFGAVPMLGNSSRDINVEIDLPKKPRRVLINANHEILAQ